MGNPWSGNQTGDDLQHFLEDGSNKNDLNRNPFQPNDWDSFNEVVNRNQRLRQSSQPPGQVEVTTPAPGLPLQITPQLYDNGMVRERPSKRVPPAVDRSSPDAASSPKLVPQEPAKVRPIIGPGDPGYVEVQPLPPPNMVGRQMQGRQFVDRPIALPSDQPPPPGDFILPSSLPQGYAVEGAPSIVVIDKAHFRTHVLQFHNGKVEDVLSVPDTVGTKDDPDRDTPEGRATVGVKRLHPDWTPPVSIDPTQTVIHYGDPRDPLGEAFISLDGAIFKGGAYGMHGTNDRNSIGYDLSHGCMRHQNEDIAKIFNLVEKGTPVYIMPDFQGTRIQESDIRKLMQQ